MSEDSKIRLNDNFGIRIGPHSYSLAKIIEIEDEEDDWRLKRHYGSLEALLRAFPDEAIQMDPGQYNSFTELSEALRRYSKIVEEVLEELKEAKNVRDE